MVLKVAYWNTRGLAEPIYLVLEYSAMEYEKKEYQLDKPEEWTEQDKSQLGVDFPNLPYLKEGDFTLCQSIAVLKYVGRKAGLLDAQDDKALAHMEELIDTLVDFKMGFVFLCHRPGYQENRAGYFQGLKPKLAQFEKRLEGRKWLMGEKLFLGDFLFWSTLDYHLCNEAHLLQDYNNLSRYVKDFESIPQIARYLASDRFKRFPVFSNVHAQWSGVPQ